MRADEWYCTHETISIRKMFVQWALCYSRILLFFSIGSKGLEKPYNMQILINHISSKYEAYINVLASLIQLIPIL